MNTNVIRNHLEHGKLTENGAYALDSTNNPLLDLFGVIGALRNRSEDEIVDLWNKAYMYSPEAAVRMLFYARDVRGGLGERRTFRIILQKLVNDNPELVRQNLENIVYFGRWDDLYTLVGTELENDMFQYLKRAANAEMVGVGKWLKSVNAHSSETNHLGHKTARAFGMSDKQYRKMLAKLRANDAVVEQAMSANAWQDINYSAVPSIAAKNYRNAFTKHDAKRYEKFLDGVEKGEEHINTAALYPYDIVRADRCDGANKTLEFQWKNLPNYITDPNVNIMVMADTSGSMTCAAPGNVRPIDVAEGLAIYFAQHNHGAFADCFMTFASEPDLVVVPHTGIHKALDSIEVLVDNTNLEAAFDLLLETAVNTHAPKEDMPRALIVISDMEIDDFGAARGATFTDEMTHRFHEAGYDMPKIIWWNVDARVNTFHADKNNSNVGFVSGASASTFKSVIDNLQYSPLELMQNVLSNPRYNRIIFTFPAEYVD